MTSVPLMTTESQATVAFDDQLWKKAVHLISDLAFRLCPKSWHARLGAGTALAFTRDYFQQDTAGQWHVAGGKGGWYTVGEACTCKDVTERQAPEGYCKHKLGLGLLLWARRLSPEMLALSGEEFFTWYAEAKQGDVSGYAELFAVGTPAPVPTVPHVQEEVPAVATEESEDAPEQRYQLPASFFTTIQGVKCIRYTGLLQLARAEGLQSLEAEWTHNEEQLSLARAVAVFQDGRRFVECGDSTPTNAARVKDAWRRMSLTRAKARCLKDALNLDLCSVEEME
jgi:hypothetical protein